MHLVSSALTIHRPVFNAPIPEFAPMRCNSKMRYCDLLLLHVSAAEAASLKWRSCKKLVIGMTSDENEESTNVRIYN